MSFEKMYLVTEAEFNKLKKSLKRSKLAQDEQIVTDSLKAVSQKRKKQGIAASLPRIQLRKYNVDAGVFSMTDKDVINPLPRERGRYSTPSHRHRRHAPPRTTVFSTPTADLPMLRRYPV